MPAVEITCYEVRCSHCDNPFDDGNGVTMHFNTPAEGLAQAADVDDWTITRDGDVYCERPGCQFAAPSCLCGDDSAICDRDACPPGCPCPLHPAVPPVPDCRRCDASFDNHAQAFLHAGRHGRTPTNPHPTADNPNEARP